MQPVTEEVVHDFPNKGGRMRERAGGIHYTMVNGEVLLEKGPHTGSYPGRVLRNARYHGLQRSGLAADRVTRTKYASALTAAEPPSAAVGVSPPELGCRSRRPKGTAGPGPTPVPQ